MAAPVADLDAARSIAAAVEGFVRAEVIGALCAFRIDDGPTKVQEWCIARAIKREARNRGPR